MQKADNMGLTHFEVVESWQLGRLPSRMKSRRGPVVRFPPAPVATARCRRHWKGSEVARWELYVLSFDLRFLHW